MYSAGAEVKNGDLSEFASVFIVLRPVGVTCGRKHGAKGIQCEVFLLIRKGVNALHFGFDRFPCMFHYTPIIAVSGNYVKGKMHYSTKIFEEKAKTITLAKCSGRAYAKAMPLYGTPQPGGQPTALQPGDRLKLFDAEVVDAGGASIPFARAQGPGGIDFGSTFHIQFASCPGPGTEQVKIQGSNEDISASYVDLYTSTDKQYDQYTNNEHWEYYRALVSINAGQGSGGALTVMVQR